MNNEQLKNISNELMEIRMSLEDLIIDINNIETEIDKEIW